MAVITITTDFGTRDFAAAAVRGAVISELPNAHLIEITHQITPFDILQAAYVVRNAYHQFPENSVHIIGVDAMPYPTKSLLAAKMNHHYFLCADNGILSILFPNINPEEVVEIDLNTEQKNSNFPTRDVLIPVACHILRGGSLNVIGKEIKEVKKINYLKPILKGNALIGTIMFVDDFGNLLTNISERRFNKLRQHRDFEVKVRSETFDQIFKKYTDIVKDFENESKYHGRGMVLFNSTGYLEIAIYKSNPKTVGAASTLFGLKQGDTISIEFNEK